MYLNLPAPGALGVTYGSYMTAVGGTSPYTYSIIAGALPPGFSLGATTGLVQGGSNTPGPFPYTAQVEDALGNKATASGTFVSPADQANIPDTKLTNGGFEDGDFSGWTVLNNDGNTAVEYGNYAFSRGFYPPGSCGNSFYAAFGTEPPTPCTIEQTVTSIPAGIIVPLGFWFAEDVNPFFFQASWNGVPLLTIDSPGGGVSNNYQFYSFDVLATGSDMVSFSGYDAIGYLGLGGITLPYVPSPAKAVVVTLIFEGVRRYRLKKPACLAQRPQNRAAFPPIQPSKPKWTRHGIDFRPERERRQGLVRTSALRSAKT